eukprot:TRINITY_DN4604_c0_g1_i1.p1 TRINITY_DN4604_c0_g1~~TRINITY_DN4604_c0_g1_i1.p1  ORF type:complete len:360 (+),score=76.52 TRINITY_DN4604_c0_g1_i1:95-1081(+)
MFHKKTSKLEVKDYLEMGLPTKEEIEERDAQLYRYHNYVTDAIEFDEPPLIIPEPGFRTELGGNGEMDIILDLEDEFNHCTYYKDNFSDFHHINYVGGTGTNPVIISAKIDENIKKDKKKGYLWKLMIWTKKENYLISLWAPNKQKMLKRAKTETELLTDLEFEEVKDHNIIAELCHMEERMLVPAYRMGVLYCKEGQNEEDEIFSNNEVSQSFTEFMNSIGTKIELKGFTGYRGGLDVKEDTTGTHSYTTRFRDFDIMFHVSVYLPFMPNEAQQWARKRHIGNDVVVIVFQDGPTGGFVPSMIHSKFNRLFKTSLFTFRCLCSCTAS